MASYKDTKADYEVVLVVCLMLAIGSRLLDMPVLLTVGIGVGIVSLLITPVAKGLTYLWSLLIKALGYINSRILLTVIFFFVLLPISLLSKLFRKEDPMKRKRQTGSYFVVRNHQYTGKDLTNPW